MTLESNMFGDSCLLRGCHLGTIRCFPNLSVKLLSIWHKILVYKYIGEIFLFFYPKSSQNSLFIGATARN